MEELEVGLLLYIIGHLWWINYKLGRLEGRTNHLNKKFGELEKDKEVV